jgi:periplasmic divalent cation tolerance protein
MSVSDKPILMYATVPDVELAQAIGASLVEAELAACANIMPGMQSIYRWQGKIERASETVVLIKTRASLEAAVVAHVTSMHPYENPALCTVPVTGGSTPFLTWILDQTKSG